MRSLVDPRRSLAAAIIWLVIGLAASFAFAASWWAGRAARQIVVAQHVRRLLLETDQLGSDLGQALSSRLAAVRIARGNQLSLAQTFDALETIYPSQGWIAAADPGGKVVASDGTLGLGTNVSETSWFSRGLERLWIGMIDGERRDLKAPAAALSLALRDASGRLLGVVAGRLTWRWIAADLERLSASLSPEGAAQILLLDADDEVCLGPPEWLHRRWKGVHIDAPPPLDVDASPGRDPRDVPHFEKLPDGGTVLIARAPLLIEPEGSTRHLTVQLVESKERVYQRANALAVRIVWISATLGVLTAVLGALGAGRLTARLRRLTHSAAAVGRSAIERIEVPAGNDEVAQLGSILARVLDDLRQERGELLSLSTELERRVAVRTREVERLAEESRYAAIGRERLKIARDLHDTLAHSMMAMLSEIRLLRKLLIHDPAALTDELAHAEAVAHDGLNEARVAIAQMRVNAVRDTGLGPALAKVFDRFLDSTGLIGAFEADPAAARFGDERAETLFRMAEEALRNIARHARASRVELMLSARSGSHVELRIADDGIGFDACGEYPGHYGLVGLREQAHLIDAELRIDSSTNSGTTLTVTLRTAPELL